jgi:hypothetical protein
MPLADNNVLAEITWLNGQLVILKDTFVAWIREEGHIVDIAEENITNNEEKSGKYDTIKYTLILDKTIKICIVPCGIWIVAAKGRVDISGPSGSEKLVYLNKCGPVETKNGEPAHSQFNNIAEEGWYWYDDSTIRKMVKLSREMFGYLLGRLQ